MVNRNKVPALMELICRWKKKWTNKYILDQVVINSGVISMWRWVTFHAWITPLREWGLEDGKAVGHSYDYRKEEDVEKGMEMNSRWGRKYLAGKGRCFKKERGPVCQTLLIDEVKWDLRIDNWTLQNKSKTN